jgi:hypothetical protein
MDPSAAELQGIAAAEAPLQALVDWLGVSPVLLTAMRSSAGDFQRVRDLVLMPAAAWAAAAAAATVPAPRVDEPTRPLNALELGQVAGMRRIARLLCGLPASDEGPGNPAGTDAQSHRDGSAAGTGKPAVGLTGRKVKLANTIDQGDDAEVEAMGSTEVRRLVDKFTADNDGVGPEVDEECDGAQLQALKNKLEADIVPYADFAVWRPFGARLSRALKFQAMIWQPASGTFVAKELPGPSTYDEWKRSWRLFSFGMRALGAVTQARLNRYADKIYDLYLKYSDLPGGGWWLVAMADIRMRSERMERLRRSLEAQHLELTRKGLPSTFDEKRPWDSVFLAAAIDKDFWDDEVRDKAFFYVAKLKSKGELEDPGHHVDIDATSAGARKKPGDGGGGGGGRGAGRKRRREAQPPAKPEPPPKTAPPQAPRAGRGPCIDPSTQHCYKWGRDGACAEPCPDGRLHQCETCNGAHRSYECTQGDAKVGGKGSKGKAAGRGGRGQ